MSNLVDVPVSITQEHISRGRPGRPLECAFALAFKAVLREGVYAAVGVEIYSIGEEDETYELSQEVEQWTDDFDQGRPVKPATFIVSVPEEYLP